MRILARNTLTFFLETLKGRKDQPAVKTALDAWFHEAERASWRNSTDVKRSYATASVIGEERVLFNIKGNSYRLVAAIDYARQTVFIKWVGAHNDYDKINVKEVRYGDQTYQKRRRPQ